MADITYTNNANELRGHSGASVGTGNAYSAKCLSSTIELAASSANDTINFGKIPSDARILGISTVYWDDLASSGSPTLDIGLASVNSNITSDDDALNDGLDVTSAGSSRVVKNIADLGKLAWEYVSGQSSDPTGSLTVYGTIKDAATNVAGTVTCEIYYVID